MKHWIITLLMPLTLLGMVGCNDDDNTVAPVNAVPATPQGVYSVTGNGEVQVFWYGVYETDIKEYRVYRSYNETSGYAMIGSVDAVANPDLNLLIYEYDDVTAVNGTTYYYAVSAVDNANQESYLSAENVFDTPRPDGQATLYPLQVDSSLAGFNLVTATVVKSNSPAADVFVDQYEERPGVYVSYLNVPAGVDIQDVGYCPTFDYVGWAPTEGWSELGYTEAIVGHTYIIWTADYHFAKLWITSINAQGALTFQWAYQTSLTELGQLELAFPAKPEHGSDYPVQDKNAQLLK